ncbi:MAG: YidC/Oxa1 family insertase periplasmic-domain containing protein, partial [Endomicrobia bacterium]|nr:YidC/Oxa1 family insertase periplasmic-domain containing protein [Endomicrobiia bacterium]
NNTDVLSVEPYTKYTVSRTDTNEEMSILFSERNNKNFIFYTFSKRNPYYVNVKIIYKHPQKVNLMFDHYVHSDNFDSEVNNVYFCRIVPTESKEMLMVEKLNKGVVKNNLYWAAVGSKYFIVGFLFGRQNEVTINVEKTKKKYKVVQITTEKEVKEFSYKLLLAPKKISLLTSLGEKFVHTVDWGTFAPLSKLFYKILTWFYKMFGNYGVAIIGLTLVIQILTFPLTYNSLKSTLKMKKLQPQIQFLQKVYKDDHKRLNMEIMNLYREKKVNPFGGCLPLLLQIPIFWALFTMLRNTYDLRGAKFILWIKDLSQPDKLFIPGVNFGIPVLVLLMGATMFLQQLLSGAMSDPQQKTFAIVMPIIFTFLFFNFPSGLVLYWFINNLFSIVTQIFINKKIGQES